MWCFRAVGEISILHEALLRLKFASIAILMHRWKVRRIRSNQKLGKLEIWNFPLALGCWRWRERAGGWRIFQFEFRWLTGMASASTTFEEMKWGKILMFELTQFLFPRNSPELINLFRVRRNCIRSKFSKSFRFVPGKSNFEAHPFFHSITLRQQIWKRLRNSTANSPVKLSSHDKRPTLSDNPSWLSRSSSCRPVGRGEGKRILFSLLKLNLRG